MPRKKRTVQSNLTVIPRMCIKHWVRIDNSNTCSQCQAEASAKANAKAPAKTAKAA